jgi:lipopolysaccharide export system permease protein
VPYIMAYVLPFALLTAVLLVFGRFSADQELTAVRASGISLATLVTPILLLSLVFCALCAAFNLWIAPLCRGSYKNLIFQVGSNTLTGLISEDRFITEIPGIMLYVRKKDGDSLHDVRFYDLDENHEIKARATARQGAVIYDPSARSIAIRLFNAVGEFRRDKEPPPDPDFIGPAPPPDPSSWQQAQWNQYDSGAMDLSQLLKAERKLKLSEMTFGQLRREKSSLEARGISAGPVRIQMHRQISFSFACFAFTLVAIPLAIQAHRRETSIGIAIALLLVMVYYSFLILGEVFQAREHLHPHLLMWAPNFLFEALGAWLLFRASHR